MSSSVTWGELRCEAIAQSTSDGEEQDERGEEEEEEEEGGKHPGMGWRPRPGHGEKGKGSEY